MSSITWSVQQLSQQQNYYWKRDTTSTTINLGTSAYPLFIVPKVEYPRLVSFSIKGENQAISQIINFYYDLPASTAEHLGVLDAEPDFQCRVGHQQLNLELSAGIYAKKTDPNEYGIKITYRCFTKEII